jgi:prolyl 4-hydroxylase
VVGRVVAWGWVGAEVRWRRGVQGASPGQIMRAMEATDQSAAVERARELDARGQHTDAINALALAAQGKDIAATTELAKRIIVGDRAPCLARQGIGLLKDAVGLGGAEAAARLAVVVVTGFAGEPDWPAALDLLRLAAGRGYQPAADQLEVLGSMMAGAGSTDLRELLVPDPGSVLNDDPRICSFPDFVSAPVCNWLIERAKGRLERALVYDVVNQVDYAGETRTNSASTWNIIEADLVHLLVQTRMAAACGQPVVHMEAPTVLHYAMGETIGDHYDFVDPEHPSYAEEIRTRGTRILTFLVYLNAGYSGGETVFPKLGLSHSGRRGEGMFFVNTHADGQADTRTLHNGRPPTAGEKWVFSQFVRDRSLQLDESTIANR